MFKRALMSALGVLVYVSAFAWVMNHAQQWVGSAPDSWLDPLLILLLFIVSACITSSLVLLKPALLYMDGKKKEALRLFGYTVACLAVLAILVAAYVLTRPPQRCGGNRANAPICGTGYHCAPEPGSHLPFGDVGGICVKD